MGEEGRDKNKTMKLVAMDYLSVLIDLNLIQAVEFIKGKVKTCRLPSALEEQFLFERKIHGIILLISLIKSLKFIMIFMLRVVIHQNFSKVTEVSSPISHLTQEKEITLEKMWGSFFVRALQVGASTV